MDRIRHLRSIQIFTEVFKLKNVTRAAEAMNTSQSSVSYHIKQLETDLGISLFRRTARGLELTEEGSLLSAYVERGLGLIRTGLEHVAKRSNSVKIAMLPMFSSRWLSPRLGSFLESNPDVQLSIQSHNNSYAHLATSEEFADLGVQWGRGDWERFRATRLWPEKLVVVCSPEYLRKHSITRPSDIQACTLMHVDNEQMWDEWFTLNNLELSQTQPQMMLEDRHFQLSSTINGLGVSLFASWLIKKELDSGELVNPFGRLFETSFAYHLIAPKTVDLSRSAKCFFDWILSAQ